MTPGLWHRLASFHFHACLPRRLLNCFTPYSAGGACTTIASDAWNCKWWKWVVFETWEWDWLYQLNNQAEKTNLLWRTIKLHHNIIAPHPKCIKLRNAVWADRGGWLQTVGILLTQSLDLKYRYKGKKMVYLAYLKKLVVDKSVHQSSFSHSAVANQNNIAVV